MIASTILRAGRILCVEDACNYHGEEEDQNASSAEIIEPSAQDRYCARGPERGAKKQRETEKF